MKQEVRKYRSTRLKDHLTKLRNTKTKKYIFALSLNFVSGYTNDRQQNCKVIVLVIGSQFVPRFLHTNQLAGVARRAPSVTLGLKMSAQLAAPATPLVNRNHKIVFFMHIHDSCTCNGDNLNLLIKTGNVHKQRILPQTTINTCKKYERGQGLKHNQN